MTTPSQRTRRSHCCCCQHHHWEPYWGMRRLTTRSYDYLEGAVGNHLRSFGGPRPLDPSSLITTTRPATRNGPIASKLCLCRGRHCISGATLALGNCFRQRACGPSLGAENEKVKKQFFVCMLGTIHTDRQTDTMVPYHTYNQLYSRGPFPSIIERGTYCL